MTIQERIDGKARGVSRRGFLIGSAASGAGLVMGYAVLPRIGTTTIAEAQAAGAFSPNIWFTMDADGIATVHSTKAEMGQHVATAIAQTLAEELEVEWQNVRVDYPDTGPQWGLFVTGGSWSINWTFDQMSRAGAAGRIALREAAVKHLGVPLAELKAESGVVTHTESGRSVSYAELVRDGITPRQFSEDDLKAIKLKPASERKLVGKSVPALDIPAKTRGQAGYGIDVFRPGMVYGTPAPLPVRYGAKVVSVDDSAAKQVPGFIKAVTVEDATGTITGWVVAVADSYPAASKAAKALKVTYDKGPNAKVSSDGMMEEARRLGESGEGASPFVVLGDAEAALGSAKMTHEAIYTTGLNIHAPLEPMNAVAELQGDVWHLYCGNQFQTLALGLLPATLGVKPEQVVIHQQYLGGGFGRRLDCDYMIAAALTAREVGGPVKLVYSRETEMTADFTRSTTCQVVKGGADAAGKLTAIKHDVVSAWATERQAPAFLADNADKSGKVDPFSVNGADFWYSVPNHLVRAIKNQQNQAAAPPGHLRSVAPGWTFWAVESFIDEMAHKTGRDPVELRLELLDGEGRNAGAAPMSVGGAKRLANVLQQVVEKSGYGKKSLPKNAAIGIATVTSQERATPTWTATAAEVSVDPASGTFKVLKLTVVQDVGTAVNPDGVKAQTEGSTLWGLSLAVKERATMRDGALQEDNFDSYEPLRMADMPEIDVTVVDTGHYPVGCGEPGVTAVAPAVANAIYNAVGARVRSLPITADKVKAAMKA